ncbi:hypothetical protein Rsub_02641 [Raphidocelis subcapitata]|uniref:Acyltransferase 3 domain-containing protein n=1 Tax=Raphidocelis subcapitata TaxID=307507 RepID=A0A2V0NYD5_9CHLO|nr:hypothetical protein Rsub_02641 [Raphidocelis subcapitata]|eukprot:GBF89937.1 hypothetical protein Rsub_02641 [Raphidocelis subcapitata]
MSSPTHRPQPGAQQGAPDCTIVLDSSDSAKSLATLAAPDAAAAAAKARGLPAAADVAPPAPAAAPRGRAYYVDWLRAALTALVVVHHCVCTYLSSSPWGQAAKKKDDPALWLLTQLFVNGNQAYFMTIFMFVSGLYTPGSYTRKGPGKFLADRSLRLLLPCLCYSLLAPPLINWWNDLAKAAPGVTPSLGAAFANWLKPGWPTTYVLPTGPPWFIWMLWCFDAVYVVTRAARESSLGRAISRRARALAGGDPAASALPRRAAPPTGGQYTTREMLSCGAALTAVMFVLCYTVRMVDALIFGLRPMTFVSRGPFVSFMPDYFVVYIVAFALGTHSGPGRWDVLNRLPSGWAGWCLAAGGVWWTLLGWVPNIVLHPAMAMQRGDGAFLLSWFLRTFVEQSFCVVWSIGLIVLFRDAFNARPGKWGSQIIGAAYAVYIVHPLIIMLYARALMPITFTSFVINAAAISAPVTITSWLVGAGLKNIPGAHRVL